ncbi:MAG: MFS transporter [Anaerolineales bacterium]|nr:MFS transporter [Anaerolineales bacterium]
MASWNSRSTLSDPASLTARKACDRLSIITSFLQPKRNRRTLRYYGLFICLGMNLAIIGPTLPSLAEQTNIRIGLIGTIFMVGSIGYGIGTLIGGKLFDQVRGHPVLGIAGVSSAVLLSLFPVVSAFPILLFIAALKGVADGIINTGANTLLLWTHAEKSPPFLTGLHLFFGVGAFLSPLLLAYLISLSTPYRIVFWLLAGVMVFASTLLLADRDSPDPAANNLNTPGSSQKMASCVPILLLSMLFLFFYVGAEVTFGSWLFSIAVLLDLTTEAAAAFLTSGFYLSFTIGRMLAIPAASCFEVEKVILIALLACLVTITAGILFLRSPLALWATALGIGFFFAPIFPAGISLAGKSMRLNARSSSIILLGDSFGCMILPWLAGLIIEATSPISMLYLVMGSLVLNLFVFAGILRFRSRTG